MRKLIQLTVALVGVALLPITGFAKDVTNSQNKPIQLAERCYCAPCPSVPIVDDDQTPSVSVRQAPSGMNGGYVCYDTRRVLQRADGVMVNYRTGGRNGCMRSGIPCDQMNKNQFGFYDSESKVRGALNRCASGTPRNLD